MERRPNTLVAIAPTIKMPTAVARIPRPGICRPKIRSDSGVVRPSMISNSHTIAATDAVNSAITGASSPVAVSPAAATHFAVSTPASAVAGNAFNFTVTALDPFNNMATGYGGTAHFTSGDGQAILPADGTLIFHGVSTQSFFFLNWRRYPAQ